MSSLQPPQSRIITDSPFDQLHVRYQQRFDCSTKALQISSRTAPNLVRYPSIFCQESPMILSISPVVAQINVRDASPVPKQTRFALALSAFWSWWRSSRFVWSHTNHSSLLLAGKCCPLDQASMINGWHPASNSLNVASRFCELRIAFAKPRYFLIMLSEFCSSSAGPVIPVFRALTNTHDRQ